MLEKLIKKVQSYNPEADVELLTKAYYFGEKAHEGQFRNSGEKFFIHPYNVALILADLNMDTATIVGGLLHDVVEDTECTNEDMIEEFSEEIAHIVDGVTKLKQIKYRTKQETQAENLRKMILAMSRDIRVIIVKLADRLHNMRTLEYMTAEKKKEKALETLEIYAPLAHRLGISKIKWELEDLSLRYLDPEAYYGLVDKVAVKRVEREERIKNIIYKLEGELVELEIEGEISGRPKSFYSIYKKMVNQGKSFEEIFDLTAVRVLVNNIKDCYAVLGSVHTLWKPLPGRFKDYIAMPKPNMYQSLHTTVIGSKGEIFEVQIRTYEMHKTAEYGIAAHWKYKEGDSQAGNFDEKLSWLRELLEWQSDLKDPKDFMETLKIDFFTDEVFVFTPNGDVINLPMGSTPIDFAYMIHTDIGDSCIGAKVDGRIVPLNYKLSNGNIVKVITSVTSGPSKDWLDIVKSTRAKNKIRQWFKNENRDENIEFGKNELEKSIRKSGYNADTVLKKIDCNKLIRDYGYTSMDDLYVSIGNKSTKINQLTSKIIREYERDHLTREEKDKAAKKDIEEKITGDMVEGKKRKRNEEGVKVEGIDNLKIRLSKCCNPVPGDEIVGYITMGRGVSVHRDDCPNVLQIDDKNRFIDVSWEGSKEGELFESEIQIKSIDRSGLLAEIAFKISDMGIEIASINTRKLDGSIVLINLTLKTKGKEQLKDIIRNIGDVRGVLDVYRLVL